MHRRSDALRAAGLVGLLALGGCSDPLDVANTNNPDRGRVLANASDVEGLVGSLYQQVQSGTLGSITRTNTGMMTAAFMNASALNNNGLGTRSSLPRAQIDNSRGNTFAAENFNDFRIHSQIARSASDAIARAQASSFTLGSPAQNDRMVAFAYFARGVALGNLALVYDSAGVPRPTDAATDIPPLEGYDAVAAEALASLAEARTYAAKPDVPALPSAWINGNALTMPQFTRLIRSYEARIRAGVARTPAENDAIDWATVAADASNGITADFLVTMDPTNGWDVAFLSTALHFRDANWHQMTYYVLGMADTTGAYGTWLSQPRESRQAFLIRTPDRRFPSGETRAAQVAVGQATLPAGVYFRNRDPGLDQALIEWHNSFYDHYRFRAFAVANRTGPFPVMTRAEIDLLAAEGYLRTANIPAAAALIDRYRVPAGLPALAGVVTSLSEPVPGGASCVPRVPANATSNALVCGTILEALKWEKRMETAFTNYGAWFFDSRRWGDLPVGTALSWPVPYQELDARRLPIYTNGGSGGNSYTAGPSTYGFGSGDR